MIEATIFLEALAHQFAASRVIVHHQNSLARTRAGNQLESLQQRRTPARPLLKDRRIQRRQNLPFAVAQILHGENQHGNPGEFIAGPNFTQNIEAAAAGEHQVKYHRIHPRIRQSQQGFFGIPRYNGSMALGCQCVRDELAHIRIVFHNQNVQGILRFQGAADRRKHRFAGERHDQTVHRAQ